MAKTDLKRELRELYYPMTSDVTFIDVPRLNFIMLDGQGAPESKQFQQSVEALYKVAYTMKFDKKKAGGADYSVMPLEGLCWAEDMEMFDPEKGDRNKWQWTVMIVQPDFIRVEDSERAKEAAMKKSDNSAIHKVRLQSFTEGKSVQIMHIGPYSEEGPDIQRMHQKITDISGKPAGKHHEIYMSDPRRVNSAKMKTVLRQPYEV